MKYATVSHFRLNLKQCKTSSPSSSHSTTVYYYTLAPNIYQVFTLIMSEKRSRCHHITPREIFLSGYELFCQATHSFFQQSHEKKKRGWCLVWVETAMKKTPTNTDFTGCNDLIEAWWENAALNELPRSSSFCRHILLHKTSYSVAKLKIATIACGLQRVELPRGESVFL